MSEKSREIDYKSEDILGSVYSIDSGAIFSSSLVQDLSRNAFVVSILFPERNSSTGQDFFMHPESEIFMIFEVSLGMPGSFQEASRTFLEYQEAS